MQRIAWAWGDTGRESADRHLVSYAEVYAVMEGEVPVVERPHFHDMTIHAAETAPGRFIRVTSKVLSRHSPVVHIIDARLTTAAWFATFKEGSSDDH